MLDKIRDLDIRVGDKIVLFPRKKIQEIGTDILQTDWKYLNSYAGEALTVEKIISDPLYKQSLSYITVSNVNNECFNVKVEYIMGHFFEYGDMCVVKNDRGKKMKGEFIQYLIDQINPYRIKHYHGVYRNWRYAHPIREPSKTEIQFGSRFYMLTESQISHISKELLKYEQENNKSEMSKGNLPSDNYKICIDGIR